MKRRRTRPAIGGLDPWLVDFFIGDPSFDERTDDERADALLRSDHEHSRLAHEHLAELIAECERRGLPRPCLAEEWSKHAGDASR